MDTNEAAGDSTFGLGLVYDAAESRVTCGVVNPLQTT